MGWMSQPDSAEAEPEPVITPPVGLASAVLRRRNAIEIFNRADQNSDGALTKGELMDYLEADPTLLERAQALKIANLAQLWEELDKNDDDRISLDEWLEFFA